MASRSRQLVERIYAGWSRGDFSSGEWAHPDIEFEVGESPIPRQWGAGAMRAAWQDWLGSWDDFRAEPLEYLEREDRVLVIVRLTGHGAGSGVELDQVGASLFFLREGRVVRLLLTSNREQALEALHSGA